MRPMAHDHDPLLRLLRTCIRPLEVMPGDDQRPLLWLAEVEVQSEPQDWRPLLIAQRQEVITETTADGKTETKRSGEPEYGPYYDVAEPGTQPPPGYWTLVDETKDPSVPSILKELERKLERWAKAPGGTTRGVFALLSENRSANLRDVSSAIRGRLPQYEEVLKHQMQSYIEKVVLRPYPFDEKEDKKYTFYPATTAVFATPLYMREGRFVRILATVITFVEVVAPLEACEDWATNIANALVRLEVDGGLLLRGYHGNEIFGRYVTSDPVCLLTHPAWTQAQHAEAVRLREVSAHESWPTSTFRELLAGAMVGNKPAAGAGLVDEPDQVRDGHDVRRALTVFEATTRPFAGEDLEVEKRPSFKTRLAVARLIRDVADKPSYARQVTDMTKEDKAVFNTLATLAQNSTHGWIKALYTYAEQAGGASVKPADHYELSPEHLYWLSALIHSGIALGALGDAEPAFQEAPCADSGLWCRNKWCRPWPPFDPDDERWRTTKPGGGGFWFPVTPGARFLIPWLDLVDQVPAMLSDEERCSLSRFGSLILHDDLEPRADESALPQIVQHWLALERGRSRRVADGRRPTSCGLLLFCELVSATKTRLQELEGKVRSWRRVMMRRFRRRGADTSIFNDVLLCSARPAMEVRGLYAALRQQSVLGALDTDVGLNLDLDACVKSQSATDCWPRMEVLIAASWEH